MNTRRKFLSLLGLGAIAAPAAAKAIREGNIIGSADMGPASVSRITLPSHSHPVTSGAHTHTFTRAYDLERLAYNDPFEYMRQVEANISSHR